VTKLFKKHSSDQKKNLDMVEGEFLSKDRRTNQVNYIRSAHFQMGFEKGFMD
jgi:hypothetical protein